VHGLGSNCSRNSQASSHALPNSASEPLLNTILHSPQWLGQHLCPDLRVPLRCESRQSCEPQFGVQAPATGGTFAPFAPPSACISISKCKECALHFLTHSWNTQQFCSIRHPASKHCGWLWTQNSILDTSQSKRCNKTKIPSPFFSEPYSYQQYNTIRNECARPQGKEKRFRPHLHLIATIFSDHPSYYSGTHRETPRDSVKLSRFEANTCTCS